MRSALEHAAPHPAVARPAAPHCRAGFRRGGADPLRARMSAVVFTNAGVVYEDNRDLRSATTTSHGCHHARELCALPGFFDARLFDAPPMPAACRRACAARCGAMALDAYLRDHPLRLRADGEMRFGSRFRASWRIYCGSSLAPERDGGIGNAQRSSHPSSQRTLGSILILPLLLRSNSEKPSQNGFLPFAGMTGAENAQRSSRSHNHCWRLAADVDSSARRSSSRSCGGVRCTSTARSMRCCRVIPRSSRSSAS